MSDFPLTFAIVTPNYNYAPYLEAALRSVLEQQYPHLEYWVMDGGSTDGSVAILQRYEKQLTGWLSQPDQGQADAINQGFARTSSEIMGWLNSDDKYLPWTFEVVSRIFQDCPEVQWLTTGRLLLWTPTGSPWMTLAIDGYGRKLFYSGRYAMGSPVFQMVIQQESTFWRRSLWEAVGGSLRNGLTMVDFDLWARFWQVADLYTVPIPLAGYRTHPDTKTATALQSHQAEFAQILAEYQEPRWSPNQIRWRSQLCRMASRWRPYLGDSLRQVTYNLEQARWQTGITYGI
ncbi:hypothetical protein BST81_08615 [Leptolyngbya sp. 'hensonii']|uniref:glycosyltransferase family 2 protein n=1 Tax=Leptolyngbya sp. 'hensonii' TaxID=1922337 RepID=UPI00094FA454|nr:glycosyltransferase family 2 protein [Leptolyngbya sp. 'hensonii']OLP18792.1 hypothetical protein BST81_08615 [Leptolyngbya sp. 'hensonii']